MWAPSTKCWTAPSPRRRSGLALAAVACAVLAAGCVTRSAHERALDELRSELAEVRQAARDRERSIEALESERAKLLAEIEDLRDARASLSEDVADRERKIAQLRGTYDALVVDLEGELATQTLRIEQLTEGLSFRLPQDVLFPPGSADLTPDGRRAVRDVAARIQGGADRVEVQGHSDDRPIKGALAARYPTNWELAAARAASVVRVLEEAGVDGARLSAVSYGSTRPLTSNETPAGRAQNRRIEVRIVPAAPAGAAGAAESAEGREPGEAAPEPGAVGAPSASEGRDVPDAPSRGAPPASDPEAPADAERAEAGE